MVGFYMMFGLYVVVPFCFSDSLLRVASLLPLKLCSGRGSSGLVSAGVAGAAAALLFPQPMASVSPNSRVLLRKATKQGMKGVRTRLWNPPKHLFQIDPLP